MNQLEQQVLDAITVLGGSAYGAEIFRRLPKGTKVGEMYDAIDVLFKKYGLIERGRTEPGIGGTTRQYWQLSGGHRKPLISPQIQTP